MTVQAPVSPGQDLAASRRSQGSSTPGEKSWGRCRAARRGGRTVVRGLHHGAGRPTRSARGGGHPADRRRCWRCGPHAVVPGQARVVQLFGRYRGTIRGPGCNGSTRSPTGRSRPGSATRRRRRPRSTTRTATRSRSPRSSSGRSPTPRRQSTRSTTTSSSSPSRPRPPSGTSPPATPTPATAATSCRCATTPTRSRSGCPRRSRIGSASAGVRDRRVPAHPTVLRTGDRSGDAAPPAGQCGGRRAAAHR